MYNLLEFFEEELGYKKGEKPRGLIKKCQVLVTQPTAFKIVAWARTYYSAFILCIKAKRVCAFEWSTGTGPRKADYENSSLVDRIRADDWVDVTRRDLSQDPDGRLFLTFIQGVIQDKLGVGEVLEDAEQLLEDNPRIKPEFIGEFIVPYTGVSSYTHRGNTKGLIPPITQDGHLFPYTELKSTISNEGYHCMGFFRYKNGNIGAFEQHIAFSAESPAGAAKYKLGIGARAPLAEALQMYRKIHKIRETKEGRLIASQRSSHRIYDINDPLFEKTCITLTPDDLSRIQMQLFAKELDKEGSTQANASYYGYYTAPVVYWIAAE